MIDPSVIILFVTIFSVLCGVVTCVLLFKKCNEKWWPCYVYYAFVSVVAGGGLWMIMLCSFSLAAARLIIIESETSHTTYFVYGEQKKQFLFDLESGNFYVQNKMNKSILIHTLPRKDHSEISDWIILRPDQISEVHYAPSFYFDKNAPKYSPIGQGKTRSAPLNAVDYYNE